MEQPRYLITLENADGAVAKMISVSTLAEADNAREYFEEIATQGQMVKQETR